MMQILVSVVIPAYKAEIYIEETLRSVLAQTYTNLEVLVVDDGSPDALGEVVQRIAQEDGRVQYFRRENAGVSAARNFGYAQSKGDYLAFLDADDVWAPQNLQCKLDRFAEDTALGLVHSACEEIDGESRPQGRINAGKEGYLLNDLLAWNGTCVPAPSSILVKREVLERVGGFDTALSTAADQEFFMRVAQHYKIGAVDAVTWYYRVHGNNMHGNIALMERDELRVFQKAQEQQLFENEAFRRYCFARMYLILAGSWWVNGHNKRKGVQYIAKAMATNPAYTCKYFLQKLR